MRASAKSVLKALVPQSVIRHKLGISGAVLFTFDDGPHPEVTPRVLDVLDASGTKGLFFIIGERIQVAPKLLSEIVQRGHGLGSHGFKHIECSRLSLSQMMADMRECRERIFDASGISTPLYRPPFGVVTASTILAAWRGGYRVIRWSVDSGEDTPMQNATPRELAQSVEDRLHDGAIVLSHDDNELTPEYLKLLLPRLAARGIEMKRGLASIVGSSS